MVGLKKLFFPTIAKVKEIIGSEAFGAPTRLAYDPRRGFLYVADSSQDRVVPLIIPKIAPNLVPPRPLLPPRRVGG